MTHASLQDRIVDDQPNISREPTLETRSEVLHIDGKNKKSKLKNSSHNPKGHMCSHIRNHFIPNLSKLAIQQAQQKSRGGPKSAGPAKNHTDNKAKGNKQGEVKVSPGPATGEGPDSGTRPLLPKGGKKAGGATESQMLTQQPKSDRRAESRKNMRKHYPVDAQQEESQGKKGCRGSAPAIIRKISQRQEAKAMREEDSQRGTRFYAGNKTTGLHSTATKTDGAILIGLLLRLLAMTLLPSLAALACLYLLVASQVRLSGVARKQDRLNITFRATGHRPHIAMSNDSPQDASIMDNTEDVGILQILGGDQVAPIFRDSDHKFRLELAARAINALIKGQINREHNHQIGTYNERQTRILSVAVRFISEMIGRDAATMHLVDRLVADGVASDAAERHVSEVCEMEDNIWRTQGAGLVRNGPQCTHAAITLALQDALQAQQLEDHAHPQANHRQLAQARRQAEDCSCGKRARSHSKPSESLAEGRLPVPIKTPGQATWLDGAEC